MEYRGVLLEELDLDALIARRPAIAIVDELAHANAPGSRHVKRWQDVLELLDRGISVWTAINVQHMESYADVVEDLTGARVRERVPDTVFDRADEVRLIDVAPEDLIRRLEEGAIYTGESSRAAIENFFKPKNLGALREIALRFAARTASRRLTDYARAESGVVLRRPASASASSSRSGRPRARPTSSAGRGAPPMRSGPTGRPSTSTRAPSSSEADKGRLEANLSLARKLGAEVLVVPGADVAEAVIETARAKGASMIVVGRSGLSRLGLLPQARHRLGPHRARGRADRHRRRPGLRHRARRAAARLAQARLRRAEAPVRLPRSSPSRPSPSSPSSSCRSSATAAWPSCSSPPSSASPSSPARAPWRSSPSSAPSRLDFFFIPPLYTFTITLVEDWLLFGVYFLVAFVTGSLVSRVHSRERLLARPRERGLLPLRRRPAPLRVLLGRGRRRGRRPARRGALRHRGRGLRRRRRGRPRPRAAGQGRAAHRRARVRHRRLLFRRARPLRSPDGHPARAPRLRYVPACRRGKGRAGRHRPRPSRSGKVWTRADDNLVQSLGRTLALSVERFRSEARSRKAVLRLESERLGGILLDSVSHELRTPLTTITGSA